MDNQALQTFFASWLGKPVEVEDPTNLDQCFDWAFKYCDFLGIPHAAIRHLRAYEIFTAATDETRQYFTLVPNTPEGIPPAGALVVFNTNIGPSGHVAVATGVGDTNSFQTTDQNWNSHQYIEYVTHTYDAVIGWLIPKQATNDPLVCDPKSVRDGLVSKASAYDTFVKMGYNQADEVTSQIAQLTQQIDGLTHEIGGLQNDNQKMAVATQHDKDTIAQQADLLKQQATSDSTAIDTGLKAIVALKGLQLDHQTIANKLGTTPDTQAILAGITTIQNQLAACLIQQKNQAQTYTKFLQQFINIFFRKGGK